MSEPKYVDGMLVEWGTRLFWPGNRVVKSNDSGGVVKAALAWKPPKPATIRARIAAAIRRAPQVMVKVTGGGRGMGAISAHFNYISRNGALELENERGEKVNGAEDLKNLRSDWQTGTSYIPGTSPRREAFNIMLSMPRDTDADTVRDAARAFARREFSNHQYVFVLHQPESDKKTDRPHVHLAVRAEGFDGKRLNPRKADLQRWRDIFAEELQERGIAARATRRVEHGVVIRGVPTWHKHAQQRGSEIRKEASSPTKRELDAHADALHSWRQLAKALAVSDLKEDQQMAVGITRMVSRMPVVPTLMAQPGMNAPAPGPERDSR